MSGIDQIRAVSLDRQEGAFEAKHWASHLCQDVRNDTEIDEATKNAMVQVIQQGKNAVFDAVMLDDEIYAMVVAAMLTIHDDAVVQEGKGAIRGLIIDYILGK